MPYVSMYSPFRCNILLDHHPPHNRITKAAFNMLTKNLALDLAGSGVNAVCVHPGWLRTRMGTERALWSVEEGVRGILDNYVLGFDERTHNGEFFHAVKAERLPW